MIDSRKNLFLGYLPKLTALTNQDVNLTLYIQKLTLYTQNQEVNLISQKIDVTFYVIYYQFCSFWQRLFLS